MKVSIFALLSLIFLLGCQNNSNEKIRLMNEKKVNIKPYIYDKYDKSLENEKDRQNSVALSNIKAKTKIEIAKIHAKNQALIAQLQAKTSKEVADADTKTKITTAQIDSTTKAEGIKNNTYIAIALIAVFAIALILFYLNSKKSRELKAKLHKEDLDKEILLHERELTEKRLHKMLELVGEGKLSTDTEQELIKSLTATPTNKIIEHKK